MMDTIRTNRRVQLLCLIIFAGLSSDLAEAQTSAHTHGTGAINVAVDNGSVQIELEAPGADIVGFEHEPTNDAEHDAINQSRELLSDGPSLFEFSNSAACQLQESSVDLETEHGDHATFHAYYKYICDNPPVEYLETNYFALFPAAEELEAQVITATGQISAELTAGANRLNF